MPGKDFGSIADLCSRWDEPWGSAGATVPRAGMRRDPYLRRLLLVDDDHGSLKAIARLLKRDFELTAVSCADAALGCLGVGAFDIALVDHRMKPLTGALLLAHLRVREPSVRRILMSAGRVDELDEYMALGVVQGFLPKPLEPREALRMLAI